MGAHQKAPLEWSAIPKHGGAEQVTFSLNVSPVLLSVLDQIAKEVEDGLRRFVAENYPLLSSSLGTSEVLAVLEGGVCKSICLSALASQVSTLQECYKYRKGISCQRQAHTEMWPAESVQLHRHLIKGSWKH